MSKKRSKYESTREIDIRVRTVNLRIRTNILRLWMFFCSLGPGKQLPEKTPCIGQGIKHDKICRTGHEKTSFM